MKLKNQPNLFLQFWIVFQLLISSAFGIIPHPDHVVVLVLENHAYNQIVGSAAAPYINNLINNNKTALFTQSFGTAHPSQPNYLQLFSGTNQGVTNNLLPTGLPFTAPNLGAQLIAASKTFIGYSETLPSVGYTGENSGAYARKHNPWVNWQGGTTNGIPSGCNQPFTSFPSNFDLLPAVSFVVPNLTNCMHDGTDPTRITVGDTWVQNNLDAYIQWAKTHNSLFILTFDEDDNASSQHILTLFTGSMVQHGSFPNYIDHYNILRLLEDMFNLPRAGAAANATPIDYCWSSCSQPATISAGGPISFCRGGSVTLTASSGASYLWSNGATSQSIVATSSGNYSVNISDGTGCSASSAGVAVSVSDFISQGSLFNETMGMVTVNSAISTHEINNGFDNDALVMAGTGEVRASSPSSGYSGASAGGNIFLTNVSGTNFIISNVNASSVENLQLSFGIFKSTTTSTGSDLLVRVSVDGINYTTLSFPALPSGTGTATWYYRTVSGNIPLATDLKIQFLQNSTTTQYRIDDISLKYSIATPSIAAGGVTTFCQGGSVSLSATNASAYSWSNGSTNQSITAASTGVYSVIETGTNGCTAVSNIISVNVLPDPAISGFNPSTAHAGDIIIINGSNFSGAYSVTFNGVNASTFTILSSSQISAVVPAGATTGSVTVTNNCGSINSANVFTVLPATSSLNLKLFIQGYYLGNGVMISVLGSGICDTVTVELHDSHFPFNTVFTDKNIIGINGRGTFNFDGSVNNNSYYIKAISRNSVSVWSSNPVLFSATTNYDFTFAANQAFGNNMKNLGDGNYGLYSGDITRDGAIDALDMTMLEYDNNHGAFGYNLTDINGDGASDALDMTILEYNGNSGIFESNP